METTMTETPQPGDLKIWYIHQVPGKPYSQAVPDIATGQAILDAVYQVALFGLEHRWWPDFANMGGISRYEKYDDGDEGWFDLDDEEIAEALGVSQ
ncbi:hypothetical protein SEA_ODAY_71 [Gordonia phage ODay]|nr:hypothetical protein SEA_ODAY_71 [Gordonia phage ODay]